MEKLRNWCITSFDTRFFKIWPTLTDSRIRLLSFQLEKTTTTGKVHLQVYLETYSPITLSSVKTILGDSTLHAEQRRGTRLAAYDYTRKEDNDYWYQLYPQWVEHGARIPGTEHKQIGVFSTRQGERTDLLNVIDMVRADKNELQIAETCPREYIKFSTGIKRWLQQRAFRRAGKYSHVEVILLKGDPGLGKTRYAKDRHGYENVYTPKWNGTKFWFDGYQDQSVLLINEIDHQNIRLEYFLQLTDNWYLELEQKGSSTVSNWHTIYITTNDPVEMWFNYWEGRTIANQKAFARRIDCIVDFGENHQAINLCDIPRKTIEQVTKSSITLVTSVPLKSNLTSNGKLYSPAIFTNEKRHNVTNGSRIQAKKEVSQEGQEQTGEQENRYPSRKKDSRNSFQTRHR